MNNETTDRVFIDSDQDKPRIIYRETSTLTTNVTLGSYVGGTVQFNLLQIKASSNTLVEVYVKDNQTSRVYTMPFSTVNSSGQYAMNAYFFMSSEEVDVGNGFENIQYVNCTVYKRGGALTDTYSVYVVLYSTNINDNLITGKYT